MIQSTTTVAGITVPSVDPLFLSIVGLHIGLGLASVAAGAIAMLSAKAPGRHPNFGTIYFWSLGATFLSAAALSVMRWSEDYHLFVLGAVAFVAAYAGRAARRSHRTGWARIHIVGMGTSYLVLLTAFYVDNGAQLPLWRNLPSWTYWALPALVGAPLILWALFRHPLVKRSG